MVTGHVRITTRDYLGRLKFDSGNHNLVVALAKPYLADLVRGTSYALGAMAVGSDDTEPADGDTTLGAELGRVGVPAVGTDTSTQKNLRTGNVVTLRNTITGIDGVIREYGSFGAIASPPGSADEGTLFNRSLIGPDTVVGTDVTTIETTLAFF